MQNRHKLQIGLICFALITFTLIIYWPVRSHDFVNYDDPDYVTENPIVQQGLTGESIAWAFKTGHSYNWHPVTWLSHLLDHELFGLKAGGHHFNNILFHAINSLLLFLILRRMTNAIWKSAIVAALFAWHPLHVESVAWVCERKDVLSTFFWMLTLWAYARYTEKPTIVRYLFIIFPFVIGLMAKPMLVTLPFVLLLLDFWPLRRTAIVSSGKSQKQKPRPISAQKLFLEKIPLLVIAFAASIVTFLVQRSAGAVAQTDAFPIAERLGNAAISYIRYLGKTFWPTDLSVFYPYQDWQTWQIAIAFLILITVSITVILLRQNKPYLAVGWFWFLGTLVPVIGLVQVGTQAMADRYTYVPLIGFFIFLVWGVASLLKKPSSVQNFGITLVICTVLVGCLITTRVQIQHWRNSETLFSHALKIESGNLVARVMLGNALAKQGDFQEAKAQYEAAIAIRPDFAEVYFNLGNLLVEEKQLDEAIARYALAIQKNPAYAHAHANMAITLGMKGDYREAISHYEESLRIDPNDPVILRYLASDLITIGKYEEAANYLRRAIAISPNDAEARQALQKLVGAKIPSEK